MSTRIAILDDYQNVALRMADWSTIGSEAKTTVFNDHVRETDALADRLAEFEIICAMRERTPFTRELFERLPNLKLIVSTGMRNAAIDMRAAADHGVMVCGTGGTASSTAELTWALIHAVTRNVPDEHQSVRDGGWQTGVGFELRGRTLGLLGLGRIGSQVARVGSAFRMELIAWSQNLTQDHASSRHVELVAKDELFERADVLSIHLVLSRRTRGLVSTAELARMKSTAYLINTSRGPIVDESALVHALHDKRIAGAGLDVFDQEPLPRDHPLRTLRNAVLTPHIGYVTDLNYGVFFHDTLEDIVAYLKGDPVRVIDAD